MYMKTSNISENCAKILERTYKIMHRDISEAVKHFTLFKNYHYQGHKHNIFLTSKKALEKLGKPMNGYMFLNVCQTMEVGSSDLILPAQTL